MDISNLEEKYRNHSAAIDEIKTEITQRKIEINLPIAHTVLTDLSNRIEQIFNAMLLLGKSDNLYSLFVLYRSILEHFFRAFYIFAKTSLTEKDETAEKYQKHLSISEFLAEQAGYLDMEDMMNESEKRTDFLTFFLKKHPQFQGFDKNNQKEISAGIKEFGFKDIIKFFHSDFVKRSKFEANIVAQIIPEYSLVSTFTHGGSYASQLMQRFAKGNSAEEEIRRILEISLTISGVTKENVFTTFKIGPGYLQDLNILQKLRGIS